MKNSPNSGNETAATRSNRRLWVLLSRTGLGLGIILLLGTIGGVWWAWIFVHQRLAPIVEENLSQTLKRPVQLGKVEGFSINNLRFGASSIPVTPTDPDRASVEGVDVVFDPLALLFRRTLELDITLVNPDIYVEQDKEGRWVSTELKSEEPSGPIKTDIQSVRVQNADVVLVPTPKIVERKKGSQEARENVDATLPSQNLPRSNTQDTLSRRLESLLPRAERRGVPVAFRQVGGTARFFDNNQRIRFDVSAQSQVELGAPTKSVPQKQQANPTPAPIQSSLKLSGEYRAPTGQTNLQVQGQNLSAVDVDRLAKLPIDLYAGLLDGNLEVRFQNEERATFLGTAILKNVKAQVAEVPQPFSNANGLLRFNGYAIALENVSALYGQVPAVANGVIDTQEEKGGYNIAAQVKSVAIATALNTLKVESPFPVTGQVRVDVQLKGALEKPILSGTVATLQPTEKVPLIVDKVNFRGISGQFQMIDTLLTITNIRALPSVGGRLAGNGRIQMGDKGGLVFDVIGQDIPGDAVAQIYNAKPSNIQIGTVAAKAQLFGTTGNLQTVVQVQAPQATYPGSGEVIVTQDKTYFRNTTLRVGAGTVNLKGQVAEGRWEVAGVADDVQLARLAELPPQLQSAQADGAFNLAGSVNSFQAETIRGTAQANVRVAGGTVKASKIALNAGRWQASGQASAVQLRQLAPQLPPQFQNQTANGSFNLSGSLAAFKPETISGTASVQLNIGGGSVNASNVRLNNGRWQASGQASAIQLATVLPQLPVQGRLNNGSFNLSGSLAAFTPETISGTAQGNLQVGGGRVSATNVEFGNGRWQASGQASGVQLATVLPQIPPQFRGQLNNASFNVSGSLENVSAETITGEASGRLNLGGGTVTASNIQFNNGRWQARGQASGVQLARVFPELPPQFQGRLNNSSFNVSGSLGAFSPQTVTGTASGSLNVGGGTVSAANVEFGNGRWQARGQASEVQLATLFPELPPQFQGQLNNGSFKVSGSLAAFTPETLSGTASGSLNLAGGSVSAANVQFGNGRWQASGEASNIELARVFPQSPQFQGQLNNGSFNLSGSLAAFSPETITGTASGNLNLGEGSVSAANVQFGNGRWQASGEANGVQLAKVFPQLPPQFQGRLNNSSFNLSGSLAAFTPATLNGTISGSLNVGDGTLTASNVQLQDGRFAGLISANNVDLEQLAAALPDSVPVPALRGRVSGNVDASGSLSAVNPAAIRATGQLRVEDFAANDLVFDPILTGQINLVPGQPSSVELAGNQQDRISLVLSPSYQPVSFLVKRDEVLAQGNREGDLLVVDVQNVPLKLLKDLAPQNALASLPPAIASQPIEGKLSGDFILNLANFNVAGNDVAIAQPVLGTIKGDLLTIGSFRYANGTATLDGGEFRQGESLYALAGSVTQTSSGPELKGSLKVAQGKIQNVLPLLQIFDLQDLARGGQPPTYASAAEVKPQPVGLPNATLEAQLRRLSEIEAILAAQKEEREASPIPELKDLTGNFSGGINVAASPRQGINLDFDFGGNNWKWGRDDKPNRLYTADNVIVKGSFQNGVLTLLPLRIESEETLLAFTGTLGGTEQSGQLRLRNVPVAPFQQFANLPVDITGNLNGTATLAGSINNPQAIGELTLIDGTLNQTAVQAARGSFRYTNARLTFSSTIATAESGEQASPEAGETRLDTQPATTPRTPSPIASIPSTTQITGSIPFYQLPFASVAPDNNQLSLDLNVQNEGLSLLNLLSRSAVTWVDGTGQVQLNVQGTVNPNTGKLNQLVANGIATVDDATIKAQALPEPLTDVNGRVLFNFDRIQVENFRGDFSGGEVVASGAIPISGTGQESGDKLTVSLEKLAVNLKGLYSGGVNGNVQITGSALNPQIGGEVRLADGRVLIGETAGDGTNGTASPGGGTATPSSPTSNEQPFTPAFNNLQLALDKGVEISRPPLLSFQATGGFTLNGTLDEPQPKGTIRLTRGQVNLFTTQFRLARGYEHTAEFTPSEGLDPVLDIRLVASVSEVTRSRIADTTATGIVSSEISDVPATNLGALRTVRIQARATGSASQLADNLELTSNPPRSESEIVALLGGGFVETLGRGDTTLGLANLAGSALLTPFQNVVGDALGLSEFRLFPTVVRDEKSRTSTLGLAAEVGVSVTPKLSASVSKILTADEPPEFGVTYRVNNEILLRGGTDLSGETRGVVEYEKRF
ncbi:translocation/assembly module TamB [Coleofasciculus sp. FACHB-T130]|uniref:translocation/assembly module TamB domain-containing protein n=1 Tax=Cyanophyceae TaxID=3028117 RepID=UPI001686E002|nr:translocation/assembly module TamB [Coleofasciculus sp. FACHB-T130]MBD1878456.1 translocation/assembly module TamB domain-containing protein [Coleofasciculus sp. FACHB-T130]